MKTHIWNCRRYWNGSSGRTPCRSLALSELLQVVVCGGFLRDSNYRRGAGIPCSVFLKSNAAVIPHPELSQRREQCRRRRNGLAAAQISLCNPSKADAPTAELLGRDSCLIFQGSCPPSQLPQKPEPPAMIWRNHPPPGRHFRIFQREEGTFLRPNG
jgi:hypothetical protein